MANDKNALTITKKVDLHYVPITYTIKSITDTELVLIQNTTGDTILIVRIILNNSDITKTVT
jgi:hypothetical protein